ncbi:MAG: Arc family DNA binding domain-containing protein [bacterium]
MENKKSIILRIDPKLWNDLNEWAKNELRSVNGQIEYVLREAVKKRKKEKD